jgi:hypothetical protein
MTDRQKQYAATLTVAISSRNPNADQVALIEKAKTRTPKIYTWCEGLAVKVRCRVDQAWAETWEGEV